MPVAHRDQHRDRVRQQAADREQNRLGARRVEPLGVVDQHQHRRLLGVGREQAQRPGADGEPILSAAGPQRQRALQRRGLRCGYADERPEGRAQELEQPGERNVGLGLDPAGAQDPHALGMLGRIRSNAVLPIPASPTSPRTALRPVRASAMTRRRAIRSGSRPTSIARF